MGDDYTAQVWQEGWLNWTARTRAAAERWLRRKHRSYEARRNPTPVRLAGEGSETDR